MITRGIKHDVDRFITEMAAKYLPHRVRLNPNDKKEKIKDVNVQLAVRPVQFWEIVFPETSKEIVLNTLWPQVATDQGKTEGHFGNIATMKYKKYLGIVRRFLGKDVKPIPEDYKRTIELPVYKRNIEFLGIGVKDDAKINGVETL